jgi:hypothetical protein
MRIFFLYWRDIRIEMRLKSDIFHWNECKRGEEHSHFQAVESSLYFFKSKLSST